MFVNHPIKTHAQKTIFFLCLVFPFYEAFSFEGSSSQWHFSKGKACLDVAEGRLALISQKTFVKEVVEGSVDVEKTLLQAAMLMQQQQQTQAGYLLYQLLSLEGIEHTLHYSEVLFRLAEILYAEGMVEAASAYYRKVIRVPLSGYVDKSFIRVLEIAKKNENLKDVDEEYEWVLKKGYVDVKEKIAYAQALLEQKRADDALKILLDVPEKSIGKEKSDYLKGVAYAIKGQYASAKSFFTINVQKKTPYFYDESLIALARIAMEEDDLETSLAWYKKIKEGSALYEDALFEKAWVYVRYAETEKEHAYKAELWRLSLRAVDAFVKQSSNIEYISEALALAGHVYLQLQYYVEASAVFSESQKRVSPMLESLALPTEDRFDPIRYVDEFSGTLPSKEISYLNVYVRGYLEQMPSMRRAVRMIADLRDIDHSLKTMKEYLVAVEKEVYENKTYNSLGSMDEVFKRIEDIDQNLLDAQVYFMKAQTLQIQLSEKDKTELQTVLNERKHILETKKAYENEYVHGLKAALYERVSYAYDECMSVEMLLSEIKETLSFYGKMLSNATDVFSVEEAKAIKDFQQSMTPEDKTFMSEHLAQEKKLLSQLQEEFLPLFEDVKGYRHVVMQHRDRKKHLEDFTRAYNENLEKEQKILSTYASSSESDQKTASEIQRLKRIFSEKESFLTYARALFDERMRLVSQETHAMLKDTVELSENAAKVYSEGLDGVVFASRKSASFVYERLNDIYVKSDVGVLDVVWKMKEDTASSLSTHLNSHYRAVKTAESQHVEILFE